jgi:hypothetical protein
MPNYCQANPNKDTEIEAFTTDLTNTGTYLQENNIFIMFSEKP